MESKHDLQHLPPKNVEWIAQSIHHQHTSPSPPLIRPIPLKNQHTSPPLRLYPLLMISTNRRRNQHPIRKWDRVHTSNKWFSNDEQGGRRCSHPTEHRASPEMGISPVKSLRHGDDAANHRKNRPVATTWVKSPRIPFVSEGRTVWGKQKRIRRGVGSGHN